MLFKKTGKNIGRTNKFLKKAISKGCISWDPSLTKAVIKAAKSPANIIKIAAIIGIGKVLWRLGIFLNNYESHKIYFRIIFSIKSKNLLIRLLYVRERYDYLSGPILNYILLKLNPEEGYYKDVETNLHF